MKVNTIICEYNPFHNGHLYHIRDIKSHSDNPIVAVMSGNFTQRGDIAIVNKFTRADAAVRNGADLVLELPAVYACASAQTFARAGVEIADALGCTENLCFGAENADARLLGGIADAVSSPGFGALLRDEMKNGEYYPRAVQKVVRALCGDAAAEAVGEPNNILAVEYIRALRKTNIGFYVTERAGAAHDESAVRGGLASASYIRGLILGGSGAENLIPDYNARDFEHPANIKRLEPVILYRLRSMTAADFALLPDVGEGLENRIYEAAREACSLEELFGRIKTKRYTLARLRRIMICAVLGITKPMTRTPVPYLRALSFNSTGASVMGEIKRRGTLPLITNVADGVKMLGDEAKRIFDVDLFAGDIFSLATDTPEPCGADFRRKISVIE